MTSKLTETYRRSRFSAALLVVLVFTIGEVAAEKLPPLNYEYAPVLGEGQCTCPQENSPCEPAGYKCVADDDASEIPTIEGGCRKVTAEKPETGEITTFCAPNTITYKKATCGYVGDARACTAGMGNRFRFEIGCTYNRQRDTCDIDTKEVWIGCNKAEDYPGKWGVKVERNEWGDDVCGSCKTKGVCGGTDCRYTKLDPTNGCKPAGTREAAACQWKYSWEIEK